MTTTAEKIKVMQAFEAWEEVEIFLERNDSWVVDSDPSWNWQDATWRIKPPDPEPLECWVNFDRDNRDPGDAYPIDQREDALSPGYITARMRQVTPQDEQDRKDAQKLRNWERFFGGGNTLEEMLRDAARLRRLVAMAGVAWQPGNTEWCQAVPGNLLREEIDKVLEGE